MPKLPWSTAIIRAIALAVIDMSRDALKTMALSVAAATAAVVVSAAAAAEEVSTVIF